MKVWKQWRAWRRVSKAEWVQRGVNEKFVGGRSNFNVDANSTQTSGSEGRDAEKELNEIRQRRLRDDVAETRLLYQSIREIYKGKPPL